MSKYYKNRIMGMGAWVVAFLFLCLPVVWGQAEVGTLTVSGGSEGTDYTYVDNTYTILTEKALTFSGTTTTTDHIVVKEGVTANVTISDVSIDVSSVEGKAAILLQQNAKLTLTLISSNTLKSGSRMAGIQVEKGASVTIEGEGSLNSQGGWGGAGIGAGSGTSCGTILIKSGTVNAYPGDWAFGLGAGEFSKMTSPKEAIIQIEGGTVHAGGNNWGSSSMIGTIKISGGSVTTSYHTDRNGPREYRGNAFGDITILGSSIDEWKISDNITVQGGTLTNCSFSGEATVEGGTFTNCSFSNLISLDENQTSFTNCKLTFKGNVTLTKNYEGCTFDGAITIQNGTFTNCSFGGESFVMYKGTINNTDGSNITANKIFINGGNINITCGNKPCISVLESSYLEINGGNIKVNTVISYGGNAAGEAAAIGSIIDNACGTIIINGGIINAQTTGGQKGGGAAIGGAGKHWQGGYNRNGGTITINGGTIFARGVETGNDIGGGWEEAKGVVKILGGSVNALRIKTIENAVYLGITPEIADVTDVSVDDKPYYVPGNHDSDNKLYLYMTADKHTITVRTKGGAITTYNAEYKKDGNTTNGYFTITQEGGPNTPTEKSVISFENKDYTAVYTPEEHKLEVKLNITVKQTEARLRSAAMNSVQLVLTDTQGLTYYSDRQEVGASDEYTFTFSTKGLEVGEYTLAARYGGSAESLQSNTTVQLEITKAAGTNAPDYKVPSVTATYGQTLTDVALPTGWTWDSPTTQVGTVKDSPHTYIAAFTPSDTKNYEVVRNVGVPVTVGKAMATEDMIPDPKASCSAPLTYGDPLSKITLTKGWEWKYPTDIPDVEDVGPGASYAYDAIYTGGDYDNYDWSKLENYDEYEEKIVRDVLLTNVIILKANLTAEDFELDIYYDDDKNTPGLQLGYGFMYDILENKFGGIGDITAYYFTKEDGTTIEMDEDTEVALDLGNYTFTIDVEEGTNFTAAKGLTDDSWTFTVVKVKFEDWEEAFWDYYDHNLDEVFEGLLYDGTVKPKTTPKEGLKDLGEITFLCQKVGSDSEELVEPIDAGTYIIKKIAVAEDKNNESATFDWSDNTEEFTIDKADLTEENFATYFDVTPQTAYYDGTPKAVTITLKPGITGTGEATVTYYDAEGNKLDTAPKELGNYTIKASITGGENVNATTELEVGTFTIAQIPTYSIAIDASIQHGTVAADKATATEGETITLTVTPEEGYIQQSLSYTCNGRTTPISGTTFVMPAGDVTVTATFKAKPVIDPDPDPTPEPDPDPDPMPVYYTVTLPAVEGATTDPVAGEYEVESWDSFGFFLTLAADYDQSKPVVSTSRGETIEPRASDGKYVIRYVRSDLEIRIEGIQKNPDPVANERIEAETIEVRGGKGCLYLRLGMRREVYVYTFTGSLIRRFEAAPGDSRRTLPKGNYIVQVDDKVYKVRVR